MVDELTAPEQDEYAKARQEPWIAEQHLAALRAQWLVGVLRRVIPELVASGYRMAKRTEAGGKMYAPIKPADLTRMFRETPGLDKRALPAEKPRRR